MCQIKLKTKKYENLIFYNHGYDLILHEKVGYFYENVSIYI